MSEAQTKVKEAIEALNTDAKKWYYQDINVVAQAAMTGVEGVINAKDEKIAELEAKIAELENPADDEEESDGDEGQGEGGSGDDAAKDTKPAKGKKKGSKKS